MSHTLWSARWSAARGYTWQRERDCDAGTALQWLAVFQKDEPEIKFVVSDKKPTNKELYKITGWNPL